MTTQRDSQRKRVYSAEWTVDHGRTFDTLAELDKFCNKVYKSEFWRYHFGQQRFSRLCIERGRGHSATAYKHLGRITFGTKCQNVMTACHELAHIGSHGQKHDKEFVQAYLKLLRRYGDPGQADALREAFKAKKVRCARSTPPGAKPKQAYQTWSGSLGTVSVKPRVVYEDPQVGIASQQDKPT